MSTSAVSPSAMPVSNSSPPRASRPAQPRPTTYTGPSSMAQPSAAASPTGSTASSGPPIPPPPRTSSQRQAPNLASTAPTSGESRPQGHRRGASVDGQQERERSDRERERADRERKRANEDAAARNRPSQPVGRSNSTSRTASGSNSGPQPVERSSSTRKRQEESGGSRRGASGASAAVGTTEAGRTQGSSRKETRFGDYILGQTLGEGEFGKVKLGWRRDGGAQVAIKLIRRDSVSPHPNRLSKIYREISILRTLSHPNIVRLHEMVETDRHIGIILEYASGGELFDYILTHRYLKDPPACRLFAQLVSGVGYLHKKGIVHRDLKLENLLLDRNRNIIITDFGFANVFDPNDELGELEHRLDDPVTLKELEKGIPHNAKAEEKSLLSILGPGQVRRKSDLMATSCGSPCYAAPELVVSDGLYTGRKVDVWSCGVILYAMLAGYLPFDDDPANPEGDNINLLYKYIVSTPLTFPEYVTPHARDLLRRILVPDPRKRADLFEVARHSWLSPFADIVNKVTSATTGIKDVETITTREPKPEAPLLTRSASVREPASTGQHSALLGGHVPRHHPEQVQHASPPKANTADAKRRTVQVEYVEPQSQTKRGSAVDADLEAEKVEEEDAAPPPIAKAKPMRPDNGMTRAATTAGTVEVGGRSNAKYHERPKGKEPVQDESQARLAGPAKGKARPVSFQYQQTAAPRTSVREGAITDGPASTAPSRRPSKQDQTGMSGPTRSTHQDPSAARPSTAHSLGGSSRLPSRGKIAMPKSGKPYNISNPIPQPETAEAFDRLGLNPTRPATQPAAKGHKRANTIGGTSSDAGKFLGKLVGTSERPETASRTSNVGESRPSRQSMDQSRIKVEKGGPHKVRRFSLLPQSFSLRGMSKDSSESKHERRVSRSASKSYNHQPQVASQPQLTVPHTTGDGDSAITTSDVSIAAQSLPTSAYGREDSVGEAPPTPEKSRTTLKKHKKFGDAFDSDMNAGSHGSSGPARRVMDFFRRRGVVRSSKGATA